VTIRRPTFVLLLVAGAASVLGVGAYLRTSQATLGLGFPLDDAWIHQTYARNLAATGVWSFVPGRESGGSTSPMWTALLAVGHRLGFDPRWWAYVLGAGGLAVTAATAGSWLTRRTGAGNPARLAVALLVALEWHLLWAAASGMELILLLALSVVIFRLSEDPIPNAVRLALLVGIGVWIRPDAVTLAVVPALAVLVAPGPSARRRLLALGWMVAAIAVPFALYLAFNLSTAGSLWPSTFYAKQAEYAVLRERPLVDRFFSLAFDLRSGGPLVGPGLLLLPAAFVALAAAIRQRRWIGLAPAVWAVGYLAMFALRLPVTYQHGRYQMPVLPVLLVFGAEGILRVWEGRRGRLRLLAVAWAAATGAVTASFVVLGARAYAQDVAVIESEMVETARWIRTNTEPSARIAAHDIGALGYFGDREVLDLAGLADASVIPLLRDERRLAELLVARRADYLMTFPGWYPRLAACGAPVYASRGTFSAAQGGEAMHVYRWPPAVDAPKGCMLYSPRPSGDDPQAP